MELVYLWVEDYKNIKKQGFNFLPKFTCTYDETSKELTIDENKDYLENFFGDNINVTAIVGENGSGKSNLLDLILDIDGWASTLKQVLYLTIKDNKLKLYLLNFNNKVICQHVLEQQIVDRTKTGIAQYALSNMGLSCAYLSLSPFLNKVSNFYSNSSIDFLSIYNYKEDYENNTFNFNDFFFSLIPSIPALLEHDLINSFFKLQGKPEYLVFKISKELETSFYDDVKEIFQYAAEQKTTKDTCIYMVSVNNTLAINLLNKLNKKIEKEKEELSKQISDLGNIKVKKYIPNINNNEIFKKVNLLNELKDNTNKNKLSDLKTEFDKIRTIELYFTDANYQTEFYFSTGELVLLYYIKKLQELNEDKKDLVLLIDECELFLHPEWQKKFVKFLSELFNDTKYNRQIIISSHSPFILSDIPKDNVIFLEKGEQKNIDINTFGANIHTLLSHGFFMQDGLMGEFAKSKINKIINFHKKAEPKDADIEALKIEYKEKRDKFWQTQSIIGEDYLKQVVKNHLVEIDKILLGEDYAKNAEIERLELELSRLKSIK